VSAFDKGIPYSQMLLENRVKGVFGGGNDFISWFCTRYDFSPTPPHHFLFTLPRIPLSVSPLSLVFIVAQLRVSVPKVCNVLCLLEVKFRTQVFPHFCCFFPKQHSKVSAPADKLFVFFNLKLNFSVTFSHYTFWMSLPPTERSPKIPREKWEHRCGFCVFIYEKQKK